ncbi:MAG: phosphoribosylglycinamide formyltransferase [Thaumarchaeota archaeon]|nr:phosphoribosylglycinamide formyltransferase [Nitrososphaerota archaeon]
MERGESRPCPRAPPRMAVLISGRGSNMVSLVRAALAGRIRAEPAVVVSSREGAAGLEAARRLGVPTETVRSAGFAGGRAKYDREIRSALRRHGVTPRAGLVCLAGYMRIVGPELVSEYRGRVLNVHPALLPSFPGLNAQRQALDAGVRVTGCTVHFVDAGVDTGPVIVQRAVRVLDGDTEESLSARILAQEHRAYVEAASMVADGRVRLRRGRAVRA